MTRKQHPNDYERAIIRINLAEGLSQGGVDCFGRTTQYSLKSGCIHWLCEIQDTGHLALCGFKLYRRAYGNWRLAVSKFHPEAHRLSKLFKTNALEKKHFGELTIAEAELQDHALWLALGKAIAAMIRGQDPSSDGLPLSGTIGHFPGNAWTESAWDINQAGEHADGRSA